MSEIIFRILEVEETASTNTDLKQEAQKGAEEGLVIWAKKQTKGRGRMGKTFHSPLGGLYFSILLRPSLPLFLVNRLTFLTAVSLVRTLKRCYGLKSQVKWVNDLYINRKKLCGILVESAAGRNEKAEYVVIGIGLNLAFVKDCPDSLQKQVISLEEVLCKKPDSRKLLEEILKDFSSLYQELTETQSFQNVMEEYSRSLFLLGEEIWVQQGEKGYSAKALALTPQGGLLVEDAEGKRQELISGEISVKPTISQKKEG